MEAQQAEQRAEQRHDQEAEVENAQREDCKQRSRGERPASPGVCMMYTLTYTHIRVLV